MSGTATADTAGDGEHHDGAGEAQGPAVVQQNDPGRCYVWGQLVCWMY